MSTPKLKEVDPSIVDYTKHQILKVARELFEKGLVESTLGVISSRIPNTNYVLITPSGFSKGLLSEEDLVVVDLRARILLGKFKPSIEAPMHTYIHKRRPDIGTVIHTHSPMVCVFAASEKDIPCVSAEQAFYLGGRIPVVEEYSLPGTNIRSELESVVQSLKDVNAVLLRKHGAIVVGRTAQDALDTTIVLEYVATIAFHSMRLSEPKEFTRKELRFLKMFKAREHGQKKVSV